MQPLPPVPRLTAAAATPAAVLEASALDLCRQLAVHLEPGRGPEGKPLAELRARANALWPVCASVLAKDSPVLGLLQAGVAGLELAGPAAGPAQRSYQQAARRLALRYWESQRGAAQNPGRYLAELEHVGLLYRLGGLRDSQWRDEALRLRLAAARHPDAVLERDLVAAVVDHYGPWLVPPEVGPMLEFCEQLARVWLAYRGDSVMTRRLLATGVVPDSERVWALAATRGSEALRADLARILGRIDVATVLAVSASSRKGESETLLQVAKALLATPLRRPTEALLQRWSVALAGAPGSGGWSVRADLARLLGDWVGEAALLVEQLEGVVGDPPVAILEQAAALLQAHPCPELLNRGRQVLAASAEPAEQRSPRLAAVVECWGKLEAMVPRSGPLGELTDAGLAAEAERTELAPESDPEPALAALEAQPPGPGQGPERKRLYEAMLATSWEQDGPLLERKLQRILVSLEQMPALEREVVEAARALPVILAMLALRSERIEEALKLAPRCRALVRRADACSGPAEEAGLLGAPDQALAALERAGRIQAILRGVGLP